jgi:hypothetical protein
VFGFTSQFTSMLKLSLTLLKHDSSEHLSGLDMHAGMRNVDYLVRKVYKMDDDRI